MRLPTALSTEALSEAVAEFSGDDTEQRVKEMNDRYTPKQFPIIYMVCI